MHPARPAVPPVADRTADAFLRAASAPADTAPDAAGADELSDDDLEQVVGGLARTWTDALRTPRRVA